MLQGDAGLERSCFNGDSDCTGESTAKTYKNETETIKIHGDQDFLAGGKYIQTVAKDYVGLLQGSFPQLHVAHKKVMQTTIRHLLIRFMEERLHNLGARRYCSYHNESLKGCC